MPKPRKANEPIEDEFTDLPISRTRKMQLRRKRDGRCYTCGKPRGFNALKCDRCMGRDRREKREAYRLRRVAA